jgi:hypothetical protein
LVRFHGRNNVFHCLPEGRAAGNGHIGHPPGDMLAHGLLELHDQSLLQLNHDGVQLRLSECRLNRLRLRIRLDWRLGLPLWCVQF